MQQHGQDPIESGIGLFLELVGADASLEQEFERSQAEFHSDPSSTREASERILAERRHLEWFLLERPATELGGVPAEVLQETWRVHAAERGVEDRVIFLESFCGVFEVTSCEAGRGLWAKDLFSSVDYPVMEPSSDLGVQVGDLLVGRLFPFRDGLFKLSPVAALFRTPRLLVALRHDLERMRSGRRGVMRIQQLELERLFFEPTGVFGGERSLGTNHRSGELAGSVGLPTGDGSAPAPIDLNGERLRARAALVEAELPEALVREVLERISTAAGLSDGSAEGVVMETLNELAFSTQVDLELARRSLLELWHVERAARGQGLGAALPDEAQAPSVAEDEPLRPEEIKRALASFDQARAAGHDLDQIFEDLAADLGVASGGDGEGGDDWHDFPGVVGAMVEEFLWEVGQGQGEAAAKRLAILRRFSEYGQNIGVFENLSRRDLVDFAGRWLLDEGGQAGPASASEIEPILGALELFCQWCEEGHAIPLAESCADLFPALREELPRVLALREYCVPHHADDAAWDVLDARPDGALDVRSVAGISQTVRVDPGLGQGLHAGDLVHARQEAERFVISRCYPELLRELVDGR